MNPFHHNIHVSRYSPSRNLRVTVDHHEITVDPGYRMPAMTVLIPVDQDDWASLLQDQQLIDTFGYASVKGQSVILCLWQGDLPDPTQPE